MITSGSRDTSVVCRCGFVFVSDEGVISDSGIVMVVMDGIVIGHVGGESAGFCVLSRDGVGRASTTTAFPELYSITLCVTIGRRRSIALLFLMITSEPKLHECADEKDEPGSSQ
jgi:hypothetical protein